ncbi:MAG: TonB-dependent receptor [Acidobacteriota bacterium]|nr:TonB-dependent receptor [Acidobacteriota bacterium]
MSTTCRACLAVLLMVVGLVPAASAQQTGSLAGTVRDSQGGVLPGVTITASGGTTVPRSVVTNEQGTYALSGLPPGTYTVTYELGGFTEQRRQDVQVQVNRTTRLDVEMGVGTLQETVTVSGAAPVVDVSSTTTQTNITKDLYESIPTGRNPWVMAGLVPGVITGRLDVGGTEGMQQYNLEAFGSADSQKSFSIDGLKTNWPGGSGGATMQYYGFEMYEEYNMQTASGTAESDVSGIYMNMVTKSGGNRITSDHNFYFMNDALQGDNIDDELRRRLGIAPGDQTGAAGNPIDYSFDWSSTLGGPIKRDKAWFFGALRWWRLDQLQIGAKNADGSQAIDDNRIRNFVGKATWQATPSARTSVMFNRNLKDRFHRRDSPYLFVEDKATTLQDQPAQNVVAQYNQVVGRSVVVDARVGSMWGTFPSRYQSEVGPDDIALRDVQTFQRFNAAETQSLNPNYRIQANGTLSYFVPEFAGGSHDFKGGLQLSWEKMEYERIRNGDILLEMRSGVPFQGQISNTPINSDHRLKTWGAFVQDRWTLGRATINAGLRMDGVSGYLPAQSSPAGTYVDERSFGKTDVFDYSFNLMPRIGLSYDVTGTGKTAIKAYYGRFYNQFGSELLERSNPNALSTQNVVWTDRNGNLMLDPGELGAIPTFGAGLFPSVDPGASRPYSDEFNVGVEHQVVPNVAVGVSYHRRQHRNGLGVLDRARPSSAYTPEDRSYTDFDGSRQSITIYKLQPEFGGLRDQVITNVDVLQSDYDGVQFDFQKRMSNRWQMLAGVSLQKHKGFDHSGTFTNVDLNNPNQLINRGDGSVFTELPWTFTLSGSYVLPWWDITTSGKYTARDGDPLDRTQVFSFANPTLTQASETVRVAQRGTDRTETVNQFVDLRFAKRFRTGNSSLEATVDLFNLLNANHVLLQNQALGSAWGRPTRILTPRIIRFGVTARF